MILYIKPFMIEPATASIAIYLLTKTPLNINKNKQLLNKNPLYLKKKICRWFKNNKNELIERIIDETSDNMIDILNLIKIIKFNPSIFIIIYIFLLILLIFF